MAGHTRVPSFAISCRVDGNTRIKLPRGIVIDKMYAVAAGGTRIEGTLHIKDGNDLPILTRNITFGKLYKVPANGKVERLIKRPVLCPRDSYLVSNMVGSYIVVLHCTQIGRQV